MHTVKLQVYRYKGITKGINEGFYDGKYMGDKLNKKCFDNNMTESMYVMYVHLKHFISSTGERLVRFMTAVATFYTKYKKNCRADPFIYDMITYIFVDYRLHGPIGSFVHIAMNLEQFVTALLQLFLSLFVESSSNEYDKEFERFGSIGSSLGMIAKVILNRKTNYGSVSEWDIWTRDDS